MASKLALEATSKGTCYATADADAFSDGELTIHRFNQKLKYISFSAPSDLGVFLVTPETSRQASSKKIDIQEKRPFTSTGNSTVMVPMIPML